MTQIAGKAFTQLLSLNILDELRVKGQLINDGVFVKQIFVANGTIDESTDLAISTGTNTLTMPASHTGFLTVKSISGVTTLDPGSNTFEISNSVANTAARTFNLNETVWLETF